MGVYTSMNTVYSLGGYIDSDEDNSVCIFLSRSGDKSKLLKVLTEQINKILKNGHDIFKSIMAETNNNFVQSLKTWTDDKNNTFIGPIKNERPCIRFTIYQIS